MSMAALIALAVLGHASAGPAIGPDDDDRTTYEAFIQFPAEWSLMIDDANERFSVTGQRIECFDIIIETTSSGLVLITYAPHPETHILDGGAIRTTRSVSSCGYAITFEYTPSGEFLRQYYNR